MVQYSWRNLSESTGRPNGIEETIYENLVVQMWEGLVGQGTEMILVANIRIFTSWKV